MNTADQIRALADQVASLRASINTAADSQNLITIGMAMQEAHQFLDQVIALDERVNGERPAVVA